MSLLTHALLESAQNLLNWVIHQSPSSQASLQKLQHTRIALIIPERGALWIESNGQALYLSAATVLHADGLAAEADTWLVATPSELMQLLSAQDQHAHLLSGRLEVGGDVRKLQILQQVLTQAPIDWNVTFVPLLGSLPSKKLASLHQGIQTQWRGDLRAYIHEETRLIPGQPEYLNAQDELQALQMRLERLSVRQQDLQTRVQNLSALR